MVEVMNIMATSFKTSPEARWLQWTTGPRGATTHPRSGALSVAVHAWDLSKEVAIIFSTSTIVWPQVNNREGTQLHPSTENWIKDLLSMAPPIRTRPSFPLSQSLPSGSFLKPLILLHQRADRMKTTIREN